MQHAYIHVHVHIYIYIIYLYLYLYLYIYIFIYLSIYLFIYLYIYIFIYLYIYIYILFHLFCSSTLIYEHTKLNISIYTLIHLHLFLIYLQVLPLSCQGEEPDRWRRHIWLVLVPVLISQLASGTNRRFSAKSTCPSRLRLARSDRRGHRHNTAHPPRCPELCQTLNCSKKHFQPWAPLKTKNRRFSTRTSSKPADKLRELPPVADSLEEAQQVVLAPQCCTPLSL